MPEFGRLVDALRAEQAKTLGVESSTALAFEEYKRRRAAAGLPVPTKLVRVESEEWH